MTDWHERPTPARCPTCSAPAEEIEHFCGHEHCAPQISLGYAWRFSLRAALEALTDEQVDSLRWGAGHNIKSMRAALLRVLAPESEGT